MTNPLQIAVGELQRPNLWYLARSCMDPGIGETHASAFSNRQRDEREREREKETEERHLVCIEDTADISRLSGSLLSAYFRPSTTMDVRIHWITLVPPSRSTGKSPKFPSTACRSERKTSTRGKMEEGAIKGWVNVVVKLFAIYDGIEY